MKLRDENVLTSEVRLDLLDGYFPSPPNDTATEFVLPEKVDNRKAVDQDIV